MNQALREIFVAWAEAQAPREAVALIVDTGQGQEIFQARNIAAEEDRFIIDPHSWAEIDERGEILAVIHSHVQDPPEPSQADLVACEASGLPWWIFSLQTRSWGHLAPSGYTAPLIGREWRHGVLDCYSLVRDYYRETMGLLLRDYPRADEWWLNGANLYLDNFAAAGFREIDLAEIQPGDALLMKIASRVPNHAAIYIGDGQILHHLHKQLSRRELLTGPLIKRVTHILRYNEAL